MTAPMNFPTPRTAVYVPQSTTERLMKLSSASQQGGSTNLQVPAGMVQLQVVWDGIDAIEIAGLKNAATSQAWTRLGVIDAAAAQGVTRTRIIHMQSVSGWTVQVIGVSSPVKFAQETLDQFRTCSIVMVTITIAK